MSMYSGHSKMPCANSGIGMLLTKPYLGTVLKQIDFVSLLYLQSSEEIHRSEHPIFALMCSKLLWQNNYLSRLLSTHALPALYKY